MTPSLASGAAPSHQALEQAARWFSLLQSGEVSAADHVRWQAWMDNDPEARAAWSIVERISQRFAPLQSMPAPRLAADAYRTASARLARRHALRGLAALAGSGLLGWGAWHQSGLTRQMAVWGADHRTATGEVRDILLADGSRVWLNTASAFDLHYSSTLRRLRLLSGEMLVQTASDALRPFVVDTPHGRLQALGTRFTTRLEGEQSLLAVYEGAVRISPLDSGATTVVRAGQQARFDTRSAGPITAADPAREAWTRGVLLANDIPLSDLVAELRRYRSGHLALAPDVGQLRVLGSYPLRDTDATLAMLQTVLPIQLRHSLPWWTTIEASRRP